MPPHPAVYKSTPIISANGWDVNAQAICTPLRTAQMIKAPSAQIIVNEAYALKLSKGKHSFWKQLLENLEKSKRSKEDSGNPSTQQQQSTCQLKDGKLIDRMLSKSKVFLNDEEGTEDEAGKSK
eukprot:TRINITY_DN6907_c0_g1_i2.p1 TRINITY_DN6907_c0_g1~~TRINITY_DN6907_c0_g1_i2.p1  ORF type:complete len:124 (-),score=31.42 TRINITY_DN6907_c0_g1_i2:101-472(-)